MTKLCYWAAWFFLGASAAMAASAVVIAVMTPDINVIP